MLTREMLQHCIENIDYTIKHTKQIDLQYDHKKMYKLTINGKYITIEFSIKEIADYMGVTTNVVKKIRQGENVKYKKLGYKIELIEYKH